MKPEPAGAGSGAVMALIDVDSLIAGRYRLEERLDGGGRAQVWRGTDKELNRPVAVKILLTPEGGDQAFIETFRAEAQLEARMKHPGVVEVFDWGHDGDANYVVMELLEAQTLRRMIDGGTLSGDRVISIGRQAAAALVYAHADGIAHGSIGPDHVMVDPDGRTTLIDFGLQCRGTCEYPALPDSDTFALGGLLYEALVGAPPSAPRPADLPPNEHWPEHPHKVNATVSPELDHVVMKAIAPSLQDRYTTAAELLAALDELVRPKSRAWLWTLLAVIAVVLAAGVTLYFASQTPLVVPDVTGMTTADARTALSRAGLQMVVTEQAASESITTGTIMAENPPAGSEARRGAQIGVVVSTGKPISTVPALVGVDLQAASASVAKAGLVVGTVVTQNSSTFPPNTVVTQSPAPGSKLVAGSTVTLVISAGQAEVTVPDVGGLSQTDASTKLTDAGLIAQVGTTYSSTPSGIVVSQGPSAGSTVPSGSTVTLSVSKGPAPVRIPNVVGAQSSAAVTSLQDAGLVPVSVPTSGTAAQVGTVIDQSPDAGNRVAPGTQVKIFVGQ